MCLLSTATQCFRFLVCPTGYSAETVIGSRSFTEPRLVSHVHWSNMWSPLGLNGTFCIEFRERSLIYVHRVVCRSVVSYTTLGYAEEWPGLHKLMLGKVHLPAIFGFFIPYSPHVQDVYVDGNVSWCTFRGLAVLRVQICAISSRNETSVPFDSTGFVWGRRRRQSDVR